MDNENLAYLLELASKEENDKSATFESVADSDKLQTTILEVLENIDQQYFKKTKLERGADFRQKKYEELIKLLISEKGLSLFMNVFQTEGGSFYFVLPSKKCFRMKKETIQENSFYQPYFFTTDVQFLTDTELNNLKKYPPNLNGFSFKSRKPKNGLIPIEFGSERISHNGAEQTLFKKEQQGSTIKVTGAKTRYIENNGQKNKWWDNDLPLYHVGHKITLVLK